MTALVPDPPDGTMPGGAAPGSHVAAGPARRTGHEGASGRLAGRIAAAAIAASVLLMFAVSASGPSAVVPLLPRTWPAPPWWLPLRLSGTLAEALTFAAVIAGAAGVGCGLVAVRRGARPPGRLLLAAGLIAVAVFAALPPAGSSDSLSYAAYGRIAAIGRSPYLMTPAQLRASGDPIGRQTTLNWSNDPSLYGPVATASQWAAAELGGSSIGRIVFWLKVWLALAFAAVAAGLDRLLRADPAARARAHLLWTLNPLMLWVIMAGAHVDGLAAGLGFLGLLLVRPGPRGGTSRQPSPGGRAGHRPSLLRAAAGGSLIGLAAAVKLPFLLFGVGLAWAGRRSVTALAAAVAGAGLVLAVSYRLAGPAALGDLRADGSRVALDSLWRLCYGFGTQPAWVIPAAVLASLAMAALLAWRLPAGPPGLAAVRPALAVTLAWLLIWPMQRSWYDAMAFCLLAVFPASRLDWLLVARSVPATVDLVTATDRNQVAASRLGLARPGATRPGATRLATAASHPRAGPGHGSSWLHTAVAELGRMAVPEARLAAVAAVVVLCVTAAWAERPSCEPIHPDRRRPAPGASEQITGTQRQQGSVRGG